MQRQRLVRWGVILSLLLTGATAWVMLDRGGHIVAATSRVLDHGSARLLLIKGARVAEVRVDSAAALKSALQTAQSGDVILLAPGTYDGLKLVKASFGEGIVITSADPQNLAILSDFTLRDVVGVTFRNVELATLDHPDVVAEGLSRWTFNVSWSKDIHFDQVKVHGSLDEDASNDVKGLAIRDSSDISVTNSEFQQLERALSIGQVQNAKVSGNSFHDLRSDAINFAEVRNVQVTDNVIRDFKPAEGDHPDAIQFWTTGTETASTDILVSRNLIIRGEGAYMQGIFMRDEVGTLPYERVTVTDNLIVGTGYNALRIGHSVDVTITNNELITFEGDNKTWFRVTDAIGVASGNRAASIVFDGTSQVQQNQNVVTAPVGDSGLSAIRSWLETHPQAAAHLGGVLPIDTPIPTLPWTDPFDASGVTFAGFELPDFSGGGWGSLFL